MARISARKLATTLVGLTVLAGRVLLPEPAHAFTGVFLADDDRLTQVREHRMAVALLPAKTVRWDQVQWSGNPTSLVTVTPVKRGSTVALGADAWFASLDGSTQPVIFKPPDFGPATGCAIGVGSRSGAFLGGCSSDSAYGEGPTSIPVTKRAVVGPSETLTLSSKDAVVTWLDTNGFAAPDSQTRTLEAYEREGYDFVVMRLIPKCGQNTSRPIRVITNETGEAARVIPTRLMSSGSSLTLPLMLYVLAAERFAVAGASNVTISADELTFDRDGQSSNYSELRESAIRSSAAGAWLTEYASNVQRSTSSSSSSGSTNGYVTTPSLFELYPGVCGRQTLPSRVNVSTPSNSGANCTPTPTPTRDSGVDASSADAGDDDEDASTDAGISDAGNEEEESEDAGASGPGADASFPSPETDSCTNPDDLTIAVDELDLNRVFLTRLQSSVFTGELAQNDLRLVPAASSGIVTNNIQAVSYENDRRQYPNRSSACESSAWSRTRPYAPPAIALLIAAIAIARRKPKS